MPHIQTAPSASSADRREELLQRIIALEAEFALQRNASDVYSIPLDHYMRVLHVIVDRVRWYLTYTGQIPDDPEHMSKDLMQVVRKECDAQAQWVLQTVYGKQEDLFGSGDGEEVCVPAECFEIDQGSAIPFAYASELPYSPINFGCWYFRASHPLWMLSLGAISVFILIICLEFLSPLYSL